MESTCMMLHAAMRLVGSIPICVHICPLRKRSGSKACFLVKRRVTTCDQLFGDSLTEGSAPKFNPWGRLCTILSLHFVPPRYSLRLRVRAIFKDCITIVIGIQPDQWSKQVTWRLLSSQQAKDLVFWLLCAFPWKHSIRGKSSLFNEAKVHNSGLHRSPSRVSGLCRSCVCLIASRGETARLAVWESVPRFHRLLLHCSTLDVIPFKSASRCCCSGLLYMGHHLARIYTKPSLTWDLWKTPLDNLRLNNSKPRILWPGWEPKHGDDGSASRWTLPDGLVTLETDSFTWLDNMHLSKEV